MLITYKDKTKCISYIICQVNTASVFIVLQSNTRNQMLKNIVITLLNKNINEIRIGQMQDKYTIEICKFVK